MIRFALVFCTAILAFGVTTASETMRIVEDHGGQVGKYLEAFAKVRSTGERVIIDGDCLSACTMVLGLVPIRLVRLAVEREGGQTAFAKR